MPLRHLLTALALVASAASAQNLKPGPWEIQNQMQGANDSKMAQAMAEMQQQLATMPPEQRKMIEDAMAKQGAQQGDCTHTAEPRSGNTQKFSFSCSKAPSRGEAPWPLSAQRPTPCA